MGWEEGEAGCEVVARIGGGVNERDLAKRITKAVEFELSGRSGLDWAEVVDDGATLKEIRAAIEAVVLKELEGEKMTSAVEADPLRNERPELGSIPSRSPDPPPTASANTFPSVLAGEGAGH